jgi:hypothetical protein
MTMEDPFADPTPRVSAFASADSFRGRLIIIEPTKLEHDVPKSRSADAARGDRITATVSVVDGKGPVQIYSQRVPTGRFLDSDAHRGVWFNQEQLVTGLMTEDGKSLKPMVLCRIDTLKPGTPAGEGNPWTMSAVSDAEKQIARDYLAGRKIAQASAPTEKLPGRGPSQPAADENPWA